MNKEQARKLIREIFERPFDSEKFKHFVKNLLNHPEESYFSYKGQFIPDAYKSHISSLERVFKYSDSDNSLDVLVIKLKKETSLERARSMQRNFVAWYLNGSRGGQLKDAALVAYVSPEETNWRFSLVKMDYRYEQTPQGKMKVKQEFTPARRWSFLVGETENSHTAQSRFEKILADDEHDPTLIELEEAFDIETVTKEFFKEISLKFTELVGGERRIGSRTIRTEEIIKYPIPDDNKKKEFAVRLIGRLMFCWFLKKKRSETGLQLIPDKMLSSDSVKVKHEFDYYHSVIELLFFEVLNTPHGERKSEFKYDPWKTIPFLNGGLFEPHLNDYYDLSETGYSKYLNVLQIPDRWFIDLFEVFELYNFTVDESTSVDVDVSVDPEMLGKIFENLLAEINPETGESARKSTGSYYTPRAIVDFMVSESLRRYLVEKTKIEEKKIDELLSDSITETNLTEDEKDELINSLDGIKIIDPACGSGAFPMGILHRILHILQIIDPNSQKWFRKKLLQLRDPFLQKKMEEKLLDENWSYIHKLGIIQNSIYGVDIQPIAVEITKLRFFLSLIVDEKINDLKENRGVEPLPNFEFKFVAANSLIGLNKEIITISEQNEYHKEQLITSLKKEIEQYLTSYGNEKNKIEIRYKKLKKDAALKAFEWKVTDSDFDKIYDWDPFSGDSADWFDPEWMFGIKEGFDLVIANPPYVAGKSGAFSNYEKQFFNKYFEVAEYQLDTYILFTEKGLKLCRQNGILTYIMPNTWLANLKLTKFRKFLLNNSSLLKIVINPENTFEAVVDTTILITQRNKRIGNEISIGYFSNWKFLQTSIIEQDIFNKNDKFIFDIHLNDYKRSILLKIERESIKMKNLCLVNRGVHAYRKDGFGQSKFGRGFQTERDYTEKSYHSFKKLDDTYHKEVRGKNVFPYYYDLSDKYISWGDWLAEPREWKFFTGERIYLRKIVGKTLYAAYVNDVNVADQSVYIAKVKNKILDTKFLISLINSTLICWYFRVKTNEFDKLFPQIKVTEFNELPIRLTKDQEPFIICVDTILSLTQSTDYHQNLSKQAQVHEYEKQIDKMVYELYGLTEEEIKIVEGKE